MIEKIMALIDKVLQKQEDPNKLTKEEIEFLLQIIKSSTFRGQEVEILYNLVLKLQNQYLQ